METLDAKGTEGKVTELVDLRVTKDDVAIIAHDLAMKEWQKEYDMIDAKEKAIVKQLVAEEKKFICERCKAIDPEMKKDYVPNYYDRPVRNKPNDDSIEYSIDYSREADTVVKGIKVNTEISFSLRVNQPKHIVKMTAELRKTREALSKHVASKPSLRDIKRAMTISAIKNMSDGSEFLKALSAITMKRPALEAPKK